ncbi:MAG: type VI secretion system baseplate subunit TssG, partial [Vicinamibacterales bacterium]
MDAKLGNSTAALSFLEALSREPYRYDFYQTLRRLECLYADRPRWAMARRPSAEPVRLGQDPDLTFAPAPLASLELGREGAPPRLQVRLFGLLGPNGPLPIHLTEYVRHRLRHNADPTLSRFLDLFHHRFIAMFYRAWAQAQPHVNRDRPGEDRFRMYVGSFVGIAPDALRDGDSVADLARLFHAGTLIRQVRNAEGLATILREFFGVKTRIEEFVAHWLVLEPPTRTRLGRPGSGLGEGAVAGGRVWDRQSKFRIHLGPLTLQQYESFLPAKVRDGRVAAGGAR